MTQLPEPVAAYEDEALDEWWAQVLEVRGEVNRAIELARADKVVGHSLDAEVSLSLPDQLRDLLRGQEELLSRVFIVSKVSLSQAEGIKDGIEALAVPGLVIQVRPAPGAKCARCWVHQESVGAHREHPEICSRCLEELGITGSGVHS
jgi:isoleucyl-tRNA synthetase